MNSKEINVEIFDILGDVNPLINKVFTEYYLKAIKYIPNVYSFLYKKEAEKALKNPRKFKRSSKKANSLVRNFTISLSTTKFLFLQMKILLILVKKNNKTTFKKLKETR